MLIREKNEAVEKGILLPDSAQKESKRGEIVCVGPDVQTLDVGDRVLVPLLTMMRVMQTGAFDLEHEGEPALVVKEEDVAVVWRRGEEGYEEKPRVGITTSVPPVGLN
ncbi:MAG: hypothetical protein GY832_31645 [Chloroflexi bacterium]|nr:hypothetical protein [Chloroflexota bacterium]